MSLLTPSSPAPVTADSPADSPESSEALAIPRLLRPEIAAALGVALPTLEGYLSGARPIPRERRRRYAALLYRYAAEVERLAGEELRRAESA